MVFLPFFKLKDFPVPEICVFEEGRYFMPIPKSIIPLTPFALPKWNPVIIYDLIQSVLQILTPDLISFKKVGSDQHAETCRCGSNLLLDTEHRNQGKGFESRPSDSLLLHLCDRSHLISGKPRSSKSLRPRKLTDLPSCNRSYRTSWLVQWAYRMELLNIEAPTVGELRSRRRAYISRRPTYTSFGTWIRITYSNHY